MLFQQIKLQNNKYNVKLLWSVKVTSHVRVCYMYV